MRRTSALLVFALLLLLSLLPQLTALEPPASSVLQVIDSEPLSGEELGLTETITLYFDRELDCDTVSAFSISPEVAGELACSGTELSFIPAGPYARATTYTITLSTDLRGADGAQLLEDYTLELNTVGSLAVAEVFPAPGAVITVNTAVTVIFNRPVVPLVTTVDMDDLPDPLTISPAAAGTGEWLNTSIYVFTPDEPLQGNTVYTLRVAAGLAAVDGALLPQDYTWSFTTQPPEMLNVSPRVSASNVGLNEPVTVSFNQPVNQQVFEAAFYVELDADVDLPALTGSFNWSGDGLQMTFTPDEPFFMDVTYRAGFRGELELVGATSWTFATVPLPGILYTSPFDGQEDVAPYGGFTIFFASPMDEDTLRDKISVEPAPAFAPEYFYRSWNNSLAVSFPTEASTGYSVTIDAGMADVYGNTIDTAFSFSYTTARHSSEMNLNVPGPVGFYSAYRDQTELFVLYRNISRLDLSLYSVPLERFVNSLAYSSWWDPTEDFEPSPDLLIRSWQEEPLAEENQAFYQLVTMTGESSDFSCPGSPPSRLNVGDTAVVISEPDPLRARASAPDGEIVELLYRNYSMPIVGGPLCANELLWWEVELRDGTRAWIAEGAGDEYFIDLRFAGQGSQVTVTPPLTESGALVPGIYYLQATAPEFSRTNYARHYMVVATANITVKHMLDTMMLWVTDVQSGQPIAGAPLTVYNNQGRAVASGETDENGVLFLDVPQAADLYERRVVVLNDEQNFGVGYTEWSSGIESWNFNLPSDYYPRRYSVYVYTDRPIYRPGQPVYFRGVVRARQDVTYTVPALQEVPVRIYDGWGEVLFDETLPLSPFGTFSGQLDLGNEVNLGFYQIQVDLPSTHEWQREGGGVNFNVAEYRLPEFQVDVTSLEPEVVQGATIEIEVDTRYFFGGPVSNATVDYNVIANPYFFSGARGYSFTNINYDEGPASYYSFYGSQIASGSGVTDANGMLVIEIPAELKETTQSQSFTIEAVVMDESQQAVAGRTSVVVHQGLVYAGVRPDTYVGFAGEETGFSLITVDWAGQPVASQALDVVVTERRWSSVQERDDTGRTVWTWSVEEIPVTEGRVLTGEDGLGAYSFVPPRGGVYKVLVSTTDAEGNTVYASTLLWVSSRSYVPWRQQNSSRIDLVADSDGYSVGDTAQVLITSPFQGTAEALITVERAGVLLVEHVTLDSNSYVYELPILDDYAPNVFVSVMIVKGVDATNPIAAFRSGMVQLGVDVNRKELNIEVSSDVERAGPQQTVTYTLRTTDYTGTPVPAEIGIGVTDLASLSIAAPNSGPLVSFFYGSQALSVRTSTPLTINTDELTQVTLDTIKGGGGGGGDEGLLEIRGEFVDTAFWNGSVVTGADGLAVIEVRLPDNLTTWRLDARAVTLGADGVMLVGQETFDLISTKPLLIRPQTPRFFVVDDVVVLAAVVNNNTDEDQTVTVAIDNIEGLSPADAGGLSQTVTVPASGRVRVTWEVEVGDVQVVQPVFSVRSSGDVYTDASISPVSLDDEGSLPVYRYTVPETVGTAGVLRTADARVESIVLPARFAVAQGSLTIRVDHSLAASTIDGLTFLQNFPHQCTEQTISRFLPNIMTYRALADLGLADPVLERNLNTAVSIALQRLFSEQKADGGWGWFLQNDSDPLTTSYALIGLAEARAQGFPVDVSVIRQAQSFVASRLIVPGLDRPQWQLNRQAFMLYALARSGAADAARTSNLYENRSGLSIYARAFLTLTLQLIDPDDSRINTLVSELVSVAKASATGVHWEEDSRDFYNWNTDTRTTAIVLSALVKTRPTSELIPNVVRHLMVQRRADAWETTQETAWAVMALTDWMVASGELQPDYSYTVELNGQQLAEGTATPGTVRNTEVLVVEVADLLRGEANNLLFERTDGPGALYYTAHLEAYMPVPEVQPVNRGIIVERRYVMPGAPRQPITEARVGEVVEVRLTIIAPTELYYVVVEDPLPAGADAINPNLQTSQQIGTRPGLDLSDPLARGWGWWWFSNIQFRDEKVVLYSTYLPVGTYEYVYTIRPGLEGTYNVIPTTAQEFYFPEVYGRGAGTIFTILPGE